MRTLFAAMVLALACATTGLYGAGEMRIEANVPDATVWIDDQLIGHVSDWSKPGRFIRPGFHRVEIRHVAHFTHYAEVDLHEGGSIVVKAILRPLLD